jgi:hypothetical protein
MSDEGYVEELDDFNSRVGSGASAGRSRRDVSSPCPEEACESDSPAKGKDASMWAVNGVNFFPCDEAIKELVPAQYEVCSSPNAGYYFRQTNALFDDLVKLPDSASEDILKNIETFWRKEEHFRSFGFLWKRGILIWGPAGSGKTCTLQQVSQNIIAAGGLSVYVTHPGQTAQGLAVMRRIEPKRPIVVMMEDLDAMIAQYGEQDVLALLDGELQIDNVVFIATTNYPERLDKRIVNRPSRFDIVKLIDMPDEAARTVYLLAKNKRLADASVECKACGGTGSKEIIVTPAVAAVAEVQAVEEVRDAADNVLTAAKAAIPAVPAVPAVMGNEPCGRCDGSGGTPEIEDWIKGTDRFSIAHLKELIVSVEVFEVDLEFALKRLSKMIDRPPKSTDAGAAGTGQYA